MYTWVIVRNFFFIWYVFSILLFIISFYRPHCNENGCFSFVATYDEIQQVECKIEEICHDYPNDVKERIYQCLLKWLKRAGDKAFLDDIVSALEKDNMLSLAFKLEKDYPMLLQKNSNENSRFQGVQLNSSCWTMKLALR